jgi:hypothetical protein
VAAKPSGVYLELACFREAPAPYLRALSVLGPTWALRASTTTSYGHHDTIAVGAA